MFKKIAVVILIAGLIYVFFHLNRNKNQKPGSLDVEKSQTMSSLETVSIDNKSYRVAFFLVSDLSKISLYSNLPGKETAKNIFDRKSCKELVNGGFYGKDEKHIGLFTTDGKTVSDYENNSTFNGFLSLTDDNLPIIEQSIPQNYYRFSLQTGPVLVKSGIPIELSIKNDMEKRRIVGGLDSKGNMIFMVFFNSNSVFQGPLLSDLPNLILSAGTKFGIKIADAVNLDGGSASAFYSEGLQLPEIAPIGSYFCIKE